MNANNMEASTTPATQEGRVSLEDQNATASPMDEEKNASPPSTGQTYTFSGLYGWRSYRILRPGRGMYHDVRRRLPYYWSDITDALTYRTCASILRMYFVK